jgi:transposase
LDAEKNRLKICDRAKEKFMTIVMGLITKNDKWKIPQEIWEQMEPLLPPRKPHPLGCHNPRVSDRDAMTAIFFVLRTGCQWNALNATGICSSSSAHRRFLEWTQAGVFQAFWECGLLAYDETVGIDWSWLSMDGAMTKAPLGGEKNRAKSHRQSKTRNQAKSAHRS